MTDPDPRPLGDVVDAVVRSLRGGTGAAAVAGVFAGWEEAVGPHVAAHARPVLLDGGRLVVEVDDPSWATQLRYLEQSLHERLGALADGGAITTVEVRVRRPGSGSTGSRRHGSRAPLW